MPVMTTSQVSSYIERQRQPGTGYNSTIQFNWNSETDVGKQVIFRMLSWPQDTWRFSYPAWVEEKTDSGDTKGRQGSAQFNLSAPLGFDPKEGLKNYSNETRQRGEYERKMIELFSYAFQLEREATIKRLMEVQGYSLEAAEEEIKNFQLTPPELPHWVNWNKKPTLYGVQVIQDGGVVSDCEIKSFTMNPWGFYNNRSVNQVGKDLDGNYIMEHGLNQLWKETQNNKLVYTPFVSKIRITARKTCYEKRRNFLVYVPEVLCDDQFKLQLPTVFYPSYWVHPDDAEKLSRYFALSLEERANAKPFAWRDYPDENGRLVFVSIHGGETHEFSCVFTDDLTPELCQHIAKRDETHSYKPSTDLSLMGGFYYTDGNKQWQPISIEDTMKACTGRFDDKGNPIVSIDGKDVTVQYHTGKLWQKPLFLRYVTKQADPVLRHFEDIENKAKVLGLPVWSKDFSKPLVPDLKNLWEQNAPAVSTPTVEAQKEVPKPETTEKTTAPDGQTTTVEQDFSRPTAGTISVPNQSTITADEI